MADNTKSTPAQQTINASKAKQARTDTITFPTDLGDFYMSFQFYDYRTLDKQPGLNSNDGLARNIFTADKANVQQAIQTTKEPLARLALPLPLQLQDSFAVAWQQTNLDLVGTLLSESLQLANGLVTGKQLISNDALPVPDLSANGYMQTVKQWGGTTVAQGAIAVAKDGLGSELRSLVELSTGIITNPNLTVLFQGPTLKTHNFSWKFSPRSAEESQRVKKILGIFKRAMHPTKLNNTTPGFIKYPSECLVEFHGTKENFLFPMRPVVVSDISINYSPNNIPSFFQDEEPVSIELSVRLQETSYYLRESFDNQDEYGADGLQTQNLLAHRLPTDGDPGDVTS